MTNYFHDFHRNNCFAAGSFLKKIFLPVIIITFLLLSSSCNEISTDIGNGLLPGSDFANVQSTDTIVPRSYTTYNSRVVSSGTRYSYIGGLHNPYFGDTYGDLVCQLRLAGKYSGGQPTVDSVKLNVTIAGAKGDTTLNPAVRLDEITDQLYSDSTYYSDRVPNLSTYLGTYPLGVVPKDSSYSVSVDMPISVGKYLMRDTLKLNQEGDSSTDWRYFFKGVLVSLQDGSPLTKGGFSTIPELLLLDSYYEPIYIRVYYHTPTSTSVYYYDFLFNKNCVSYNRYYHDRTTADPLLAIKHVNDGIMDTLTCIQSIHGMTATIKLNGLEAYKGMKNISVNKARLIYRANMDGVYFTATKVPSQLYLYYADTASLSKVVPDYTIYPTFFGGAFNSTSLTYSFNIAAFVQDYLKGIIPKPELEIKLGDGDVQSALLRNIGSTTPPTFTFVYTRF
ncbi:MAG TPA: DUF4270 family protein [Bacteroidales bacterium]|nr:DUF4270 family protein [Bacteroidales bacterium]